MKIKINLIKNIRILSHIGSSPSVSPSFSGEHRSSISRSPYPNQKDHFRSNQAQNNNNYNNSRSPSPQLLFKPQHQNLNVHNNNNFNTVKSATNQTNNFNSKTQMLQQQQSQLRKLPPVPGLNRSSAVAQTPDDDEKFELSFMPNNQRNLPAPMKKPPNLPIPPVKQANQRTLPNTKNPSQATLQRHLNTIVSYPSDTVKLVPNNNQALHSHGTGDDSDENENWF